MNRQRSYDGDQISGFLWRGVVRALLAAAASPVLLGLTSCGSPGSNGGSIPPFPLYWSVAVADLNGDGMPDIATSYTYFKSATDQPGFVAVYLQDPTNPGVFLSPGTYGVDGDPLSIAVGDLNGDGKPDIAIANAIRNSSGPGSGVSVLLQDPTKPGQFLAATHYTTGANPVSVTIGDLNSDGSPDLAVGDTSGISLLFQDPNYPGHFLPKTTLNAGAPASSAAIADLNGDGKADLVTTTPSSVVVFLQDPTMNGRFPSPTNYAAGQQPIWVASSDLDGDGKPDLAVANLGSSADGSTASLSVLLKNPVMPGSFLPATDYKTDIRSDLVVIADLNGDGKPDIAVANTGGLAGPCPPACGSSGASVSVFLQDLAVPGHFQAATKYASQRQVLSVAVADMNGDSKPDLVIADDDGIVIRFQDRTSPGGFLAAKSIAK